jgi:hypothetical protein
MTIRWRTGRPLCLPGFHFLASLTVVIAFPFKSNQSQHKTQRKPNLKAQAPASAPSTFFEIIHCLYNLGE